MSEKEILLKAFEIMMRNHEDGDDFCEGTNKCNECPFEIWEVCPNCCKECEE